MQHISLNINELLKASEGASDEGVLLLPNFQREFVWDRKNHQQELLTSIMYNIPIGSLLIVEGGSGYFATKNLCFLAERSGIEGDISNSRQNILYLLDGQQRLSTLKSILFDLFSPEYCEEGYFSSIYEALKTRWFLKVAPVTSEREEKVDLFGFNKLKFKGWETFDTYEPADIKVFIKYFKPNLGGRNWWDLTYRIDDWKRQDGGYNHNYRKEIFSNDAAREKLVPLYDIFNINNNVDLSDKLHYKVLRKIADNRAEEIKAQIKDNDIKAIDIFEDDNIYINSENELNSALKSLADNWVFSVSNYLQSLNNIVIPIIKLQSNEMTRVIYAFEYVNRGGTKLSTFDLVVARAAHDVGEETLTNRIRGYIENSDIDLPNDLTDNLLGDDLGKWNATNMDIIKEGQVVDRFKNQYLNLLSIFCHFGASDEYHEYSLEELRANYIKENTHLNLTTEQINQNTEKTVEALIRACAFLQLRCGLTKLDDLKYQLMILPIACALSSDSIWKDRNSLNKIEYWYWTALFSGVFRERQNDRCVQEIINLNQWLKENEQDDRSKEIIERKNKIFDAEDYSNYDALKNQNTAPTAVKNGLLQYTLSRQPYDFLDDQELRLNPWDIAIGKELMMDNQSYELKVSRHHIIPLGSSMETVASGTKALRDKKDHILNSPLNITFISSIANNRIRNRSLRDYIQVLNRLIINSHFIPDIDFNIDELDEESYEEFLSKRFRLIHDKLTEELDQLAD